MNQPLSFFLFTFYSSTFSQSLMLQSFLTILAVNLGDFEINSDINIGGDGTSQTILNNAKNVSEGVSQAWDGLWTDVFNGVLYQTVSTIGVGIALLCLLYFIYEFASKWLKDEVNGIWQLSELILPLVVVFLLANGGSKLADITLELRNVINDYNLKVIEAVQQESAEQAIAAVTDYNTTRTQIESLRGQCERLVNQEEFKTCLENGKLKSDVLIDRFRFNHGKIAQKYLNDLKERKDWIFTNGILERAVQVTEEVTEAGVDEVASLFLAPVALTNSVVSTIIWSFMSAFQFGFQLAIEATFLLTGLVGPIAVGATLMPGASKPGFAWITGFFSLGLCKLCLNLLTGLVALAMVDYGFTDAIPLAIFFAVFAPILSLAVASGSGMAIFNGLVSGSNLVVSLASGRR